MANHVFYCSSDNCAVSSRNGLPFYRCPKDPVRCQQWKESLGFIDDHRYANLTPEKAHNRLRICSDHFEDKCFTSSGKRLLKTAIPSKLPIKFNDDSQDDQIPDPSRIYGAKKSDASTIQQYGIDISTIPPILPTANVAAFFPRSEASTQSQTHQEFFEVSNDSRSTSSEAQPGLHQNEDMLIESIKREDENDDIFDEVLPVTQEEIMDIINQSPSEEYLNIVAPKTEPISEYPSEPPSKRSRSDEVVHSGPSGSYHETTNHLIETVQREPAVAGMLDTSGNIDLFFQSILTLAKTLSPLDQILLQRNVANVVFGMKIAQLTKQPTQSSSANFK